MTVLGRSARGLRGSRPEDVRRDNLSMLLRYVHVHGPTPRTELTAELGLNRSTIGDLTGELAAAGLVREHGGRSNASARGGAGGRPSYVVTPRARQIQVLAVDLGVTHLTVARVGLGGSVLSRRDVPHRRGARRVRGTVAAIHRSASSLLAEVEDDVHVAGAGVAVPGLVRFRDGLVSRAPNLDWRDVPLGGYLAGVLRMPVSIGNDADLGVLAEHTRGAAVGCDDAVYLSGRSGIGAGIFAAGRPLSGRAGYAGEVGHVVVNPDGRDCRCGSRGCWETECGEEWLFALAGRPGLAGLAGVREVVSAAGTGDARARAALHHVATWLGRGTASVVNVFNPELVILGGALAEVFETDGTTVRTELAASALGPPHELVSLVLPVLGADSPLLGAAELAFAPLLSDPLRTLHRVAAS